MAKRSKAYKAAVAKIEEGKLYTPAEAVALAKETSSTKTDATVEVAMRLSVDPRKADQMVRGTVNLPHGTGKTARVVEMCIRDRPSPPIATIASMPWRSIMISMFSGPPLGPSKGLVREVPMMVPPWDARPRTFWPVSYTHLSMRVCSENAETPSWRATFCAKESKRSSSSSVSCGSA